MYPTIYLGDKKHKPLKSVYDIYFTIKKKYFPRIDKYRNYNR